MNETVHLTNDSLEAAVRIETDRYGLTHIFAHHDADLWFAQGFNAARERLWQIDLWRRRGLGLLAQALGPGFLAQDQAARLFVYRGDMNEEWSAYHPGTEGICESFCRGINSYISLVEEERFHLPPEFVLLGFRPSHWAKEDIVRIRSNTISANAVSELRRYALAREGRDGADSLRCRIWPPAATETLPDIANPAALARLIELATAPVVITRDRLAASMSDIENWSDSAQFLPDTALSRNMDGSNNWALSGLRSASSKPILANDPHRALQNPPLRLAVHLSGPSFSAIGAGEPSLPGISIGHNGKIAFGLTIFPADQEEVFCFDFDEEGAGWSSEPLAHDETIDVKGFAPVPFKSLSLDANPVLAIDDSGRRGVALRSVWTEPGAAPYLGSLALLEANSVATFRTRLRSWRLPAVNFVAADRDGSIGFFVAGAIPKRAEASGLVPRAVSRDPWSGFVANEDLPTRIDPDCGYVLSANERNVDDVWVERNGAPSREWFEPYRALRIGEVLDDTSAATVEESANLQMDTLSIAARQLQDRVRIAFQRVSSDPPSQVSDLLAWPCKINSSSAPSRFFEHWTAHYLKPRVRALLDPLADDCLEISIEAVIGELDGFTPDRRQATIVETLLEATRSDPSTAPKKALFRHAIQDGLADTTFHVGPVPWDGSDTTLNFGKRRAGSAFVEWGASFRMVIDLDDLGASVWLNRPQTDSYSSNGEMLPMLYSTEELAHNIVGNLTLEP